MNKTMDDKMISALPTLVRFAGMNALKIIVKTGTSKNNRIDNIGLLVLNKPISCFSEVFIYKVFIINVVIM